MKINKRLLNVSIINRVQQDPELTDPTLRGLSSEIDVAEWRALRSGVTYWFGQATPAGRLSPAPHPVLTDTPLAKI
jgi:hypothetical protein